ncbi:MAG: hypothetical protein WBA48_13420 [Xanthobacteraceae bacterium]
MLEILLGFHITITTIDHEQCRNFSEMFMRKPDHRVISMPSMMLTTSRSAGRDVLSTANDQLLESSGNRQEAVFVAPGDVNAAC